MNKKHKRINRDDMDVITLTGSRKRSKLLSCQPTVQARYICLERYVLIIYKHLDSQGK